MQEEQRFRSALLVTSPVLVSNPDPIAINGTSYTSIINVQFKPLLSVGFTKNQTYRLIS